MLQLPERHGKGNGIFDHISPPGLDLCFKSSRNDATGNLARAEPLQLQMADDISLFFCKMGVGHGGLLSGCLLVVLQTLPENPIMSCF
jgi:hypothetical protein